MSVLAVAPLRHLARWLARCGARGIALGMSMLPEEFPVVLTVFMAMGAWRISTRTGADTARGRNRDARLRDSACAPTRPGTLTENRMSIAELRLMDGKVFQPRDAKDARLAGRVP